MYILNMNFLTLLLGGLGWFVVLYAFTSVTFKFVLSAPKTDEGKPVPENKFIAAVRQNKIPFSAIAAFALTGMAYFRSR